MTSRPEILAKRIIPTLLLLLALGGALLVVTPRRAGADPNNANCKPNRATCTSKRQCCSGFCGADRLCAAPPSTTSTTTTTTAPPTTTTAAATTTTTSTTTTTLRFVDNMNGTITDKQTGLQWEKKDTTCPGIHCVDDVYSWCVGSDDFTCVNGGVPDGTAFTSFLRTLNGGDTGVGNCTVSDDATPPQAGFAGHCDWRLPTIDELVTIVDTSTCGGGGACIDPIFGPTSTLYCSSSTLARDPNVAWTFFFPFPTFTNEAFKPGVSETFSVRAVRGGFPIP